MENEFFDKLNNSNIGRCLGYNDFKFSTIGQIQKAFFKPINFDLLNENDIEIMKEAIKIARIKNLIIGEVFSNMPDLRDLQIELLEINSGTLTSDIFMRLPQIKKLTLNSVSFSSIDELLVFENLESLTISMINDDPEVDMSSVDKLTSLKSFKISGQSLSQEEFEKICTLENLTNLHIKTSRESDAKIRNRERKNALDFFNAFANGEIQKLSDINNSDSREEISGFRDISSIVNLQNLESFNIEGFLSSFDISNIVVTDISKLQKLITFKPFVNHQIKRKITYVGSEPISAKALDGIEQLEGVELVITSPLALSEDFFEKYKQGFPGKIQIINEVVDDYSVSELFAISEKMKEILNGVPNNATEFEKVAYIYKKIGNICFYDNSGNTGSEEYIEGREFITRSLKGLLENKLVCAGYARVLKTFLDELNINCKVVDGEAKFSDGSGEGHAWNQVQIDGKWYNLDLTWDARRIRANKEPEFFLIEDQRFYETHEPLGCSCDIREFIHGQRFNHKGYKKNKNHSTDVNQCMESYDKKKIKGFFISGEKSIDSKEIIDQIVFSNEVTFNNMQANINDMAIDVHHKEEIEQEEISE